MGEYVKNKKDMNFQSMDALKTVQSVIDEADLALQDKSRRIEDSPLNEVLAGVAGVEVVEGFGLAGITSGFGTVGITSGLAAAAAGLIGGGMAVLAAPAVVLGGAGVGIASHVKNKKLQEAKELTYKNAIAKRNAIIKALKEEHYADKERIAYLNSLNTLLKATIKDLQKDLGIAA